MDIRKKKFKSMLSAGKIMVSLLGWERCYSYKFLA
jgi:hypothetical protein